MSRRHAAPKRVVHPDPKFGNVVLSKVMNNLMLDGKKSAAESIVYGALDLIQSRAGREPVEIFEEGLENIKPAVEVRSRRVGGATYQVPVEVRPSRRNALAMRWLVDSARKRGEKSMSQRLAGELMEAAEGRGSAVRKREDTHRMAEANRAFAHYRF